VRGCSGHESLGASLDVTPAALAGPLSDQACRPQQSGCLYAAPRLACPKSAPQTRATRLKTEAPALLKEPRPSPSRPFHFHATQHSSNRASCSSVHNDLSYRCAECRSARPRLSSLALARCSISAH
jgi:hypothetical protein